MFLDFFACVLLTIRSWVLNAKLVILDHHANSIYIVVSLNLSPFFPQLYKFISVLLYFQKSSCIHFDGAYSLIIFHYTCLMMRLPAEMRGKY